MRQKGLPNHVAFIMDGNRRWARKNLLNMFAGHQTGAKKIEPLVSYAKEQGISHVTFWAFSTENWKRSKEEISVLFEVMRDFLDSAYVTRLKQQKVKMEVLGDLDGFPKDITEKIAQLREDTKNNTAITMAIALNYGGRAEILSAVRKMLSAGEKNITEEHFSACLQTNGMPEPDLIIRTGGEMRLSGFMPWQSVYSELYFTKTLWPDFDADEFSAALSDYTSRQRRFGN